MPLESARCLCLSALTCCPTNSIGPALLNIACAVGLEELCMHVLLALFGAARPELQHAMSCYACCPAGYPSSDDTWLSSHSSRSGLGGCQGLKYLIYFCFLVRLC